jgi:hypothetical protein
MVHVKIEVYPSLGQALESLGKDECLYTEYSLVQSPLTIKYERRASGYRPVGLLKERSLTEGHDLVSSLFETIHSIEEKRPSLTGNYLELNESSFYFKYKYFLFRREVLVELAEVLASAVNKNDKVFWAPLKEAITLGMDEIFRKDKDFICLGIIPDYGRYLREYEVEIIKRTRELMMLAIEEEPWRENFLDFGGVREEVENWFKELFGKPKDEYFWADMVRLVDKNLGGGMGRVLAEFWENDKLLGIHSGNLSKIGEIDKAIESLKEKFGDKYVEKVFPEVLGNIQIYLKAPEAKNLEMVALPLKIRDSGGKSNKKVGFLVFSKLKIEGKQVEWNSVVMRRYDKSVKAERSSGDIYMKVLSTKEVPVLLPNEKGKKTIILNSKMGEIIDVDKLSKYGSKLGNLEKVTYKAKVENPVKYLHIDIEGFPEISLDSYGEIGYGRTIEESIGIQVFLGKEADPKIGTKVKTEPECLGKRADELIKEESRELAKVLLSLEKGESDQERKESLKLAAFVLTNLLEILEKEDGVDRKCGRLYNSLHSYYYNLYPKVVKDYRPLIERKTMSGILYDNLSPKLVRRTEKIVNLLKSGVFRKLCFSLGGERVEIGLEELEKEAIKKDKAIYLKLLSASLAKMFRNYIDQVRKTGGKGPELEKEGLRDVDEFSTLLSGAILSSIRRFPNSAKEISVMMERIYFYVFQTITGSLYNYNHNKGIWIRKDEKPVLDFKNLLLSSSVIFINLGQIVEETKVRVPYEYGEGGKEMPEKKVEVERRVYFEEKYDREKASIYINSGTYDKVVEIGWLLESFDYSKYG